MFTLECIDCTEYSAQMRQFIKYALSKKPPDKYFLALKSNNNFVQMKKILKKYTVVIIFALAANSTYANEDDQLYNQAILNAQKIEKEEILELPQVPTGILSVVTFESKPKKIKSKAPKDIWVTLSSDLKSACVKLPKKNLQRNIQKLLGLPPKNKKKQLLVIDVQSSVLIRPCANPNIRERKCSADFPAEISPEHSKWYKENMKELYEKGKKYPWTRLGYTCNWKNGKCEYGLPEFVIKKGVSITPKTIHSIESFCSNSNNKK